MTESERGPDGCPRCGRPGKRLPGEMGTFGDTVKFVIEDCIECESCKDTYIRIKGRWWS